MRTPIRLVLKALGYALGAAALIPWPAYAGLTDLATQPLAQPAAGVQPNIMLLFDDSGSMREQYTPDFIGRYSSNDTNALCLDSLDFGSPLNTTLRNCEVGDPPIMSPDFNTQYYNPTIRYLPAVNYDGSSMPSMNASYTDNWTEVPTDGVSSSSINRNRYDTVHMFPAGSAPYAATADLADGYPDRVWCDSQSATPTDSDPTGGGHCKTNNGYDYPNSVYGYGHSSGTSQSSIFYVSGAPYYYRIVPTYYCTDSTLSSCVYSTSGPTTVGGVLYGVPAPVRYCTDTTFTNCESKYSGSYTRPQFTGTLTSGTIQQYGRGTITIGTASAAGTITAVNVGASGNLLSMPVGPYTADTATDINAIASQVVLAIQANSGSSGFTAYCQTGGTTCTSGTVVVQTNTYTSSQNGKLIIVTSPGTVTANASVTFTFSGVSSRWRSRSSINSIIANNSTNLITSSIACSGFAGCQSSYTGGYDGWMADQVASAINGGSSGYTAVSNPSAGSVTITAPAGTGYSGNGYVVALSQSNMAINGNFSSTVSGTMSGGVTAGAIPTTSTTMSGGITQYTGVVRTGVGTFARTSIVPYSDAPTDMVPATYPKSPGRTDCAAATYCTYAEEMTNFANWYAYYRTRNEMAKTAIGRAFATLTDAYRVGFITINPGNPVNSSKYLAIDSFTAGAGNQKDLWYQELYGADASGGTPLREAVSRVGQYLGGLGNSSNPRLANGMGGSPIQVACQANYVVLVTDGYWNGTNAPQTLTGSSVGNQDNTDAGYHTRAIGAYDGGLAGATNTLADTAMYYYQTDLRTDLANEVPTTQTDQNPAQHMDLYTVGLGLAGQLNFDPNYLSENSSTGGDFWCIKQGGTWSDGTPCNWPVPVPNTETTLDDLWHAAVDGHGQFFSAKDPITLTNAIASTLANVNNRVGAGAAAATSNLQPVAGDNFAFTAQYETVVWTGDLKARTIDLSTGIVSSVPLWSAQSLLDQRTQYDRNIYTFDPADTTAGGGQNGNLLESFCWPGASPTSTPAYPGCADGADLSTADMTSDFDPHTLPQASVWQSDGSGRYNSATPDNLVDYLRGDSSNESTGGTATTDLYRARVHLLGDIVDAQPAYVKAAPFGYDSGSYAGGQDQFYQTFAASTNGSTGTRVGTVFAAANDGMLHAFNTEGPNGEIYYQTGGIGTATTTDDTFTGTLVTNPANGQGSERWAYVPSMLLPQLKNLADIPYIHQYYVDGSPVVGDVCFGESATTKCPSASSWHTILVGGLNDGGRGYYALDITDPNNPKGLWEFTPPPATSCPGSFQYQDCDLGYSFGNPLIVKRADTGQWVVIVTSGYNNVNPGDGQGYLYILDAQTGKILNKIGTGVGSTSTPSGLNHINAWVDNAYYDNTALRVYGVDLEGNVWRFQLDPSQNGYLNASKLETLYDPSGVPQSLTTKPQLASVENFPVVYVATGRLLGTSDVSTTQVQSVYALKDNLSTTPLPNVRTSGQFVQQTLSLVSGSTTVRTATNNAVDFNTQDGWWVDLPDPGERVNVDPQLQLGTLVVASNVPSNDSCLAGGYGWLNFFDYQTGSYIQGADLNMVSTKIAASLVVGINVVKLPGGEVKSIVTTADNQQLTQTTPVKPNTVQGRRVNWRELISQ